MENISLTHVIIAILAILLIIYAIFYFFFIGKVHKTENKIIGTFLLKVSKIPGFIEVMRPLVADPSVFDNLTRLHSAAMIHKYETIYILLEHNARIHEQFSFLMKLGMQIPELQKNAQFLYIRDFIMNYERNLKKDFESYNTEVEKWNRFVHLKNLTIIGFILPGKRKEFI